VSWSKVVLHVDMDAFYAAVEVREDPSLAGKPLIIGYKGRRGVVTTCSYEARKFGVRSAMPGLTARRLCPELIFVRHRFEVYQQVSQQIRAIFRAFTPHVTLVRKIERPVPPAPLGGIEWRSDALTLVESTGDGRYEIRESWGL